MQGHQVRHQLLAVAVGVDRALLLAAVHQLTQNAKIHALLVVPQDALLGIADAVDKAAVEGRVLGADDQGLTHKVQQLIVPAVGLVRQVALLQHAVLGVHAAGHLDDQLVLALEIVVDVAHGAAHRLGDLLHRDILKALLVEQLQRYVLDTTTHFQGLFFPGGKLFFHRDIRTPSVNGFFYHNKFWAAGQGMNAPENNKFGNFEKRG